MGEKYHIKKLGQNLKAIRKDRDLYQYELADEIGIDRKTMGDWENSKPTGNGEISIPNGVNILVRLCEVLNCDADYLLGKIDSYHNATVNISEETGLSELTVEKLQLWQEEKKGDNRYILTYRLNFLNEIIPEISHEIADYYRVLEMARNKKNKEFYFPLGEDKEKGYASPNSYALSAEQAEDFCIHSIMQLLAQILKSAPIRKEELKRKEEFFNET